ncbi:MAG TPA: peptide deformylase [Jiangellaceae bacterium]|jgi:peptide deformylase|nr:peptide deformylase [Jiangellaceae bacterium]
MGVTVREIRRYGDPVLLTVADELADFGDHTRALARDLLDTVQAPGRAGLAAPQIGVALRAFSYNVDDRLGVVFNPVLVATDGEQFGDEGCLSVPELWFPTRRSWYAAVEGFDQDGNEIRVEGEELMARCLEHEVDHLDGIVYLRRLDPETRRQAMRAVRDSEWFGR